MRKLPRGGSLTLASRAYAIEPTVGAVKMVSVLYLCCMFQCDALCAVRVEGSTNIITSVVCLCVLL
jgi:hypothetical protein